MIPTKFMTGLKDRLGEEKGLSEVSTNSYIRALYAMNVKKPFHSLNFLKKPNVIETNIEGYAPSTKTTFYTIATSVLELVKDEPGYKRPYTTYYKKMMEGRNEQKEAYAKNELTEREKSVWMTWDEVKAVHADLKKEVDAFISNAVLSKSEQDKLLSYLVLSLYVLIPPRRNRDYMDLVIVNHVKEDMPKDKNYYDLTSKKLHFNIFKTASSEGEKIISAPADLNTVIRAYLKHVPISEGEHLLPFTQQNDITRRLNKIFGQPIASGHLRHFYVSSKYGDTLKSMRSDSHDMSHSLSTQKNYIKIL